MGIRVAAVTGTALVALALAACGAPADPGGETPPPQPAELHLPEDAVLGVVGIATAPNGATADVGIVVHAALPYLVPEAADAVAATVAWCAGEVDDAVIAGRGFTFTAVDVSLSPREGDWPGDVTLAVLPQPNPALGSTLAAAEGLRQVDASDDDSLGDSVPHCRRPAVLDGAGGGTVYLGIPGDITGAEGAESFTAWTWHAFGLSAVLPGGLGTAEVTFSACAASLTPLGEEFGAPGEGWADRFEEDACVAGATST